MAGLPSLNGLPREEAVAAFARCCGAARWAEAMESRRPFPDEAALLRAADEIWATMGREDILEAFSHHPRIGGKDARLAKFASTRTWAQGEQSRVAEADETTLEALAEGNAAYEKRFGYLFIVCATGKSATEMLALLQARLPNRPEDELKLAAAEQAKITRLRLQKLLHD